MPRLLLPSRTLFHENFLVAQPLDLNLNRYRGGHQRRGRITDVLWEYNAVDSRYIIQNYTGVESNIFGDNTVARTTVDVPLGKRFHLFVSFRPVGGTYSSDNARVHLWVPGDRPIGQYTDNESVYLEVNRTGVTNVGLHLAWIQPGGAVQSILTHPTGTPFVSGQGRIYLLSVDWPNWQLFSEAQTRLVQAEEVVLPSDFMGEGVFPPELNLLPTHQRIGMSAQNVTPGDGRFNIHHIHAEQMAPENDPWG